MTNFEAVIELINEVESEKRTQIGTKRVCEALAKLEIQGDEAKRVLRRLQIIRDDLTAYDDITKKIAKQKLGIDL